MWLVLILLKILVECATGIPTTIPEPYVSQNIRTLSNRAALLEVHGPVDWVPSTSNVEIHVTLSSGIMQGQDFFLWRSAYKLPKQSYTTLYVQLYPNRLWIPGLKPDHSESLYLLSVQIQDAATNLSSTRKFESFPLAKVVHKDRDCPAPFVLPHSNIKLQQFFSKVLNECQDPLIIRAGKLRKRMISSYKLLMMRPSMMIVDGSDVSLQAGAMKVDNFLSAHAVLSIAWEPANEKVIRLYHALSIFSQVNAKFRNLGTGS